MDTSAITAFSVTPQQLLARIGSAAAPLILDVRPQHRFAAATHMVAGARRCAPEDLERFIAGAPPGEVIVYCVYGHTVSQEAAALLRKAGWNALFLAGGMEGGEPGVDSAENVADWRSARPIVVRKRPDLAVTGEQASRWITRERPKIDRIACPWLVRRFIDRRAEFLYLPAAVVLHEAGRSGAVAFDLPGAPITHEGDRCSFDSLLAAFDLQDEPALRVLARIVRAADTARLDLAPQAAGLLAFSLGLSAVYREDDAAMLEAAMPLYDALYAWCRSQADGQAETHAWTPDAITGSAA